MARAERSPGFGGSGDSGHVTPRPAQVTPPTLLFMATHARASLRPTAALNLSLGCPPGPQCLWAVAGTLITLHPPVQVWTLGHC